MAINEALLQVLKDLEDKEKELAIIDELAELSTQAKTSMETIISWLIRKIDLCL